jgi:membrane-associated protein
LCFGEAALLLGFILPGETAVVLGGVLAWEHHVSLVWMMVLVVVCAIVGDTVGYEVGRLFGPFLLSHRPLKGHRGVERTRRFLDRRGPIAVFLGRFTAVFRALIPGIAGMSGLRYRRFLLGNAAGGLIWGVGYTLAGYELGKSYNKALSYGTWVSSAILIAVAVLLISLFVWRRRRERRERLPAPEKLSD